MAYFLINTFLNHKYLDTESCYEYFRSIGGITGCLMKYHVLKSQAVNTWRKGFPDVERQAKEVKEFILKISYFSSNLSWNEVILVLRMNETMSWAN